MGGGGGAVCCVLRSGPLTSELPGNKIVAAVVDISIVDFCARATDIAAVRTLSGIAPFVSASSRGKIGGVFQRWEAKIWRKKRRFDRSRGVGGVGEGGDGWCRGEIRRRIGRIGVDSYEGGCEVTTKAVADQPDSTLYCLNALSIGTVDIKRGEGSVGLSGAMNPAIKGVLHDSICAQQFLIT